MPTIVYNNSTGSATAASGAGPATAKSEAAGAHTDGAASQWILLPYYAGDLSDIAKDGTAVMLLVTASGRQWSVIDDWDNSDAPGKRVHVADSFTIAAGSPVNWAIGGKRASPNDTSDRLLGTADAKTGWKLDVEYTGTAYTITSRWDMSLDIDFSIISSSATRPQITIGASASFIGFYVNNSGASAGCRFTNLKLVCNSSGSYYNSAIQFPACRRGIIRDCELYATGTSYQHASARGIYASWNDGNCHIFVDNSRVSGFGAGIYGDGTSCHVRAGGGTLFDNCLKGVYKAGGSTIMENVKFADCGIGIENTNSYARLVRANKCVFHGCTTGGIGLAAATYPYFELSDCSFDANGYGVYSADSVAGFWPRLWVNNNFYNNTNDVDTTNGLAKDATDTAYDPKYTDSDTYDFTLQSASSLRGAGRAQLFGVG